MKMSQVTSGLAGRLKAQGAHFEWEAMLEMAQQIERLVKRVDELEKELSKTHDLASSANMRTARIGGLP